MKNKFIRFATPMLLLGIVACSQDEELLGTEVKPVDESFKWSEKSIAVSSKTLDFSSDTGAFYVEADLGQEMTTVMTYTGLESGAVREIVTTSDKLSAANSSWKGGQKSVLSNFFAEGEQVVMSLSAYGTSDVYYDTLVLAKEQRYADIATDMKGSNLSFAQASGSSFNWWISTEIGTLTDESVEQIDGQYCKLEGTAQPNSVYVGGASYNQWGGPYIAKADGSALSDDPTRLYFNVYVYGTGDADSELYFNMYEADGDHDYAINSRDDAVQVKVVPSHKGWKLFSFKYSELPFSSYAPGGGSGNKVHEPHKICLIDIALQSTSQGGKAKVIFDRPILTIDQPFDPSRY